MIRKIANTARDYAWGSTNLIPDYFGVEATGGPMAEVWFGTHSGSPAKLLDSDLNLLEFRTEPLPFLLKILAAAAPLSIQAHPNAQQAKTGFARENALGIALDSPTRNYKDDQPKPEMVVALTEFHALTGFREATEIELLLAQLQLAASGELASELQTWRDLAGESIKALFTYLIDNRIAVATVFAELVEVCSRLQASDSRFDNNLKLVTTLEKLHPGDVGIAISLLMNYVVLQPNQALQLAAGSIHAYLSGLSLEIQGASDNVLRGGLTKKHIDTEELKNILNFEGCEVPVLEAKKVANGCFEYPHLVDDYLFYRFEPTGSNLIADLNLPNDSILLCTSGEVTVFDSKDEIQTLRRGEAAYVSGARLFSLSGNGVIFLATS